MKRKHKLLLKLNLVSLFFVAISFVSITLAWFAYSGMSSATVDVGIKAWNIQFENNDQVVSNEIKITLTDIHPGMDTEIENVDVNNLGDSDAQISYNIEYVRILNDEFTDITTEELIDKLSHDYPFHINMNLSKAYALAHGSSHFDISVSWPLDGGNDDLDSLWGNQAYEFYLQEQQKLVNDPSYVVRPSLEIVVRIKAEQLMLTNASADMNYNLGDVILFDVVDNKKCDKVSDTCLKTYVIDVKNKVGDTVVKLLPDLSNNFVTSPFSEYSKSMSSITDGWAVTTRSLIMNDLLSVISTDVINSVIVRDNLSDVVVGDLNYGTRITTELKNVVNANGYYKFNNNNFSYLNTSKCYWVNTSYDTNNAFALTRIDSTSSKLYKEDKTSICSVVPVILATKSSLNA